MGVLNHKHAHITKTGNIKVLREEGVSWLLYIICMGQLGVRIHHFKPYAARSRSVQVVWEGFLTAFASRPLSADRLDKALNSINARPGVQVWIRCIPSAVEVACQLVLCIWSMPRGTG